MAMFPKREEVCTVDFPGILPSLRQVTVFNCFETTLRAESLTFTSACDVHVTIVRCMTVIALQRVDTWRRGAEPVRRVFAEVC